MFFFVKIREFKKKLNGSVHLFFTLPTVEFSFDINDQETRLLLWSLKLDKRRAFTVKLKSRKCLRWRLHSAHGATLFTAPKLS